MLLTHPSFSQPIDDPCFTDFAQWGAAILTQSSRWYLVEISKALGGVDRRLRYLIPDLNNLAKLLEQLQPGRVYAVMMIEAPDRCEQSWRMQSLSRAWQVEHGEASFVVAQGAERIMLGVRSADTNWEEVKLEMSAIF